MDRVNLLSRRWGLMHLNLQSEARALAPPTRFRLFSHIAGSEEPVGVAELTSYLGLNHNAVRQHLAVLVEAALVTEEIDDSRASGPGRPRLLYRLSAEAAGRWGTAGPYEYLAGLFAAALDSGLSPREAGRRSGRQEALAYKVDDDVLEALEREMQRRGFRPSRIGRGSTIDFILGRCPFQDIALTNPDAVCQAHLGLVEGLAESTGTIEVLGLVAKDPLKAGCRLKVRHRPEGSVD
jgi:predicted ArsR family transcriptional regulator